MRGKEIKSSLLLVLTAVIWGLAFVAQSEANEVGVFTFNVVRSFVGAVVLLPVILFLDKTGKTVRKPATKAEKKLLIVGGIFTGIALFAASAFQQAAISAGTAAGKAGFITAFYILMVPVIGIFLKKKCGWNVWLGVVVALIGLYLLCIKDTFSLDIRDVLLFICALLFSIQILCVDYFAPQTDPIRLSVGQYIVSGLVGSVFMLFNEIGFSIDGFVAWAHTLYGWQAWIPLLYLGIFSTGVAYTLQIIAQPNLNPTIASMIMSMEAVFSVIFGWLILGQKLSKSETIGCVLIFGAVIFAQLPFSNKNQKEGD